MLNMILIGIRLGKRRHKHQRGVGAALASHSTGVNEMGKLIEILEDVDDLPMDELDIMLMGGA